MYATILASLAGLSMAAPALQKRQAAPAGVNDGVILNYALTLEHLEKNFYNEGLQKFTQDDFEDAGLDASFYNNLQEIASDEKTHVDFLTTALSGAGVTPTKECKYAFGFNDVKTFLAIANVLEGVGVSAYLGAAQYIANKAYLTAAGSILTVESRHSAYIRANQDPALSPFPAAFDIPLDFDEVYSLAAQFITECPADNPALPVKAFPALSVKPQSAGTRKQGEYVELKAAKSVEAKGAYFITSNGPVQAEFTGEGEDFCVTIPEKAQDGQAYLVLTSDESAPSDENIVAGPAVFEIADNAYYFAQSQ